MGNTCAWCKINTDKQQKFEADGNNTGCCPLCKSYNDIGQKTIEINSMKQIYRETVRLMDEMASQFAEMLEFAEIDLDDFRENLDLPEDNPIDICFNTREIVKRLFLFHTHNSGGTSTGTLKRLLGIRRECEQFIIYEKEGEDGRNL